MRTDNLDQRRKSHSFGQEQKRPGEARTLIVIVITGLMMIVEIISGVVFGSMALLADGLHMGSHAAALSINAFAYIYARRHARDERFAFGTGKVNTLGGFVGAILLSGFAFVMVWESLSRLSSPVALAFDQAIFVAVLGLIVNGASVFILGHHGHPDHEGNLGIGSGTNIHGQGPAPVFNHQIHHDHNLLSAYLHVLADALTSFLAIFALLAAKYFGLIWADPAMGIIGAVLVARWSFGLLRSTALILLDREGPEDLRDRIKQSIESHDDNRVTDLHVWAVGPNIYSAIVSLVTHHPKLPDSYKDLMPVDQRIVHLVVEVNACDNKD